MESRKLKELTSLIYVGAFGSLLKSDNDINDKNIKPINNLEDLKIGNILPVINVKKNNIVIESFVKYEKTLNKYLIEKEDIIVSKIGNIGETFLFKGLNNFNIGILSSNFFGLKVEKNEKTNKKILTNEELKNCLIAVKQRDIYKKYMNNSFTVGHISLKDFSNIDIKVNDNMKSVSQIITKHEEKIKLLEKMIENKNIEMRYFQKELLSGRLKFVDNGLVENNDFVEKNINGKLKQLPNNWNTFKLNEVCDFQQGRNFTKNDYQKNGKTKVVRIKDVLNFENNDIQYTNNKENNKYIKNKEDYLICFTGYNDKPNEGSIGKIYRKKELSYFTNELYKFNVKNSNENSLSFISYLLETHYYQKEILKYSKGSVIKHAKESKDKLEVSVPNIKEQEVISNFLELQEKCLENLKEQKNINEKMFKFFLSKI